MKKIAILVLALSFIAISCKKDRTCTCTVTKKGTSTTTGKVSFSLFGFPAPLADTSFTSATSDEQIIDKKMEKVSKRVAKANCVSYSEPYKEIIPTSVPASSFNLSVIVTNEGVKEYECELK